jgi:hypothetical protein
MSIGPSIASALQEARKNKTRVYISGSSCPVTFTTFILSYNNDIIYLENTVLPAYISQFVASEQFSINLGMLQLKTDKIVSNGQDIGFPLTHKTTIEETRSEARLLVKSDDDLICLINNPFDKVTQLRKRILDLSSQGVSLTMIFGSRLFETGMVLPEITIVKNGKTDQQRSGKVVYNRKLVNEKGQIRTQVGIHFI